MLESLFYSLRPAMLLKESLKQVFFCEFCKHISKKTFFYRAPTLAASVKPCNFTKIRFATGVFCELSKISKECFF